MGVHGTNYRDWASDMKAVLLILGLWRIVNGTIARPSDAAESAAKWDERDEMMAQGNIIMRISQDIRYYEGNTSADTWTNLAQAFGNIIVSHIYTDFRSLVNFKIGGGQHPGAEISRVLTHVKNLKASEVSGSLPDSVLGMMLLNALPPQWDYISTIYLRGIDSVDKIKLEEVREAIIDELYYLAVRGSGPGQRVHKISTIKRNAHDNKDNKKKSKRPRAKVTC